MTYFYYSYIVQRFLRKLISMRLLEGSGIFIHSHLYRTFFVPNFNVQCSLFNDILSKLEIHGEVTKKGAQLDEQARFIKLPIGWLMIVSFSRSDQCPRKPDAPVFVLEHVCSCVYLMCVVWLCVAETLANNRGFNIDYHFTQRLDYVDDAYSFGTQAVVKRDTSTAGGKWIGQHGSSASLFFVLPMASCLVVAMTPSYRVWGWKCTQLSEYERILVGESFFLFAVMI